MRKPELQVRIFVSLPKRGLVSVLWPESELCGFALNGIAAPCSHVPVGSQIIRDNIFGLDSFSTGK